MIKPMKNQTSTNNAPARLVRMSSVGWMLKRLGSHLDTEMSVALKKIDLNLNQFVMLMTLMESEGLTQAELGKKISMPAYATTRTLDALEATCYVERRTDERSRRSYRIFLTPKGQEIGPVLFKIVERVNEKLLAVLLETEKHQLKVLLNKLLSARSV